MKQCNKCPTPKDLKEFSKLKKSKDGHHATCKECLNSSRRAKYLSNPEIRNKAIKHQHEWRKNNPDKVKKWEKENPEKYLDGQLRRKFGIGFDQYLSMKESQDSRCAICKKHQNEFNEMFCVDHDHLTGKIRGLLCRKCNSGIGLLQDSLDIVKSAAEYLERNK
jgi:hypothetical protein